jgi:hypothetical protein
VAFAPFHDAETNDWPAWHSSAGVMIIVLDNLPKRSATEASIFIVVLLSTYDFLMMDGSKSRRGRISVQARESRSEQTTSHTRAGRLHIS